jgi:hypothetical protein
MQTFGAIAQDKATFLRNLLQTGSLKQQSLINHKQDRCLLREVLGTRIRTDQEGRAWTKAGEGKISLRLGILEIEH